MKELYNDKYIDMHMHSCYSDDGEYTPAELVEMCRKRNIRIMAIADHNCVRANFEGQKEAEAAGIKYIPAIEIDCTYENVNFHVLGYGIDYEKEDFQLIEKNIRDQSREASYKMLHLTRELGFHVEEKEMEQLGENNYWNDMWNGEMFAEVLLHKLEYEDHPLLLPYRKGGERADNPYVNFYWDYYSQGKPCYAEIKYPSMEEVVDIIHRNGGQAVLAHPGINLKDNSNLLLPVIQTGIDGIEAFSSYHSGPQAVHYYEEAMSLGRFVTCGSDFHGKTKPAISLGDTGCMAGQPEIEESLKQRGLL